MTTMHPADRTYRNQTVRLADLTVVDDVIDSVMFENCELVGPAVIALLEGTTFTKNAFADGVTFWTPTPAGAEAVFGVVALRRTTVVGCKLRRIGLAVLPGQEEVIRAGIG